MDHKVYYHRRMRGLNRSEDRAFAKGCKSCACRVKGRCCADFWPYQYEKPPPLKLKEARKRCKGNKWQRRTRKKAFPTKFLPRIIQRHLPRRLHSSEMPRRLLRHFQRKKEGPDETERKP